MMTGTTLDDSIDSLRRAVKVAGSQLAFAGIIGVTQSAVSKMLAANRPLDGDYVLAAERGTGISRHDLRPDLYPRDDSGESDNTPLAARADNHRGAGMAPMDPLP